MSIEKTKQKNLNADLEGFACNLEHLIATQGDAAAIKTHEDNGLVIAINAPWGAGKSFFINWFIKDRLEDGVISKYDYKGIPSSSSSIGMTRASSSENTVKVFPIIYDAWEDDDFDPFIGLVGQLCQRVEGLNQGNSVEQFKKAALGVWHILHGCGMFSSISEESIQKGISEIKESGTEQFRNAIEMYNSHKKKKNEFKKALSSLGDNREGMPVKIIFIDELDRCAPAFAVCFLETIKHYFNTKNTVFIVSMDKRVLSENIRHFYGQGIDAERYLSRFFDFELDLPVGKDFYKKLIDKNFNGGQYHFYKLLLFVIDCLKLAPREINKLCNQLQHLSSITPINRPELVMLLALKISDSQKFNMLTSGLWLARDMEVSDEKKSSQEIINENVEKDSKDFLSIFNLNAWPIDDELKKYFGVFFLYLIYKNKPYLFSFIVGVLIEKDDQLLGFLKNAPDLCAFDKIVEPIEQIIKLVKSFSNDL